MTIKRVVNGVEMEFVLTNFELFDAYCEQEQIWDIQACTDYFSNNYSDEEWFENVSAEVKQNIIEAAAFEMRRSINKYDTDFEYAISDAFVHAISEYIEEA